MTKRTAASFRRKVSAVIKELSKERLKVALDFLEYLKEKEEFEATWEIMNDSETMAAIQKAEEDWKSGKMDQFVPIEEVKRRVQDRSKPPGAKNS